MKAKIKIEITTHICDGCNVRQPFEHRCHGQGCDCGNPVCMERQGKITWGQLMAIVNKELKQNKTA